MIKLAIVSPYISTDADLKYYQSQQVNLAVELVKLDLQVDIFTLKRNESEPDTERLEGGVNIYRLPLFSGFLERVFKQPVMRRLWRKLKNEDYDFILSSEDIALTTLYTAIYTMFSKSRLIIQQGLYAYSEKKNIKVLMYLYDLAALPVLRYTCWMAICKTIKAKQYLLKKGFKRVCVIPAGVNISKFSPDNQVNSDTWELLAVGNLIPLKRHIFLLSVFRHLMSINSKVRLTIIGKGPEKAGIVDYIQRNSLVEKVSFLQDIPNSQMKRYYSKSSLLLSFSKIEIFGMVILEAMASGCPVMATPTPGAMDVISDNINGFIVSDDNPGEIACRINSILNERGKLVKIREEAISTAATKYSWPIIAKQYYDLFTKNTN